MKSAKVTLISKGGKRVEFPAGQVDYMLKQGWSKAVAPEPESESDKTEEAESPQAEIDSESNKTVRNGRTRK